MEVPTLRTVVAHSVVLCVGILFAAALQRYCGVSVPVVVEAHSDQARAAPEAASVAARAGGVPEVRSEGAPSAVALLPDPKPAAPVRPRPAAGAPRPAAAAPAAPAVAAPPSL